jgi:hypothetical protein
MTEDELRAVVRAAIARVRAGNQNPFANQNPLNPVNPLNLLNPSQHPSHALFLVNSGADESGPCIIEPAVPCNHCGYCKSMGH